MIDLHVHSTASDGTLSPSELAIKGRDFSLMAITDHDNCDGVKEFLAAGRDAGADSQGRVRLSGIELSVNPGEGYGTFHLLGLGIDPDDEGLKRFLLRVLDGRNERNARILARFSEIGIVIDPRDIATYAHGEILARPHFARWLVDHGYSPDVRTAFKDYLMSSSPPEKCCYAARYRPDPGDAIDVIHRAGGVAVMAHPKFWTGDPRLLREGLFMLKARGLDGVEAIYQANEFEETLDHLRAAKEVGLLVTAGSDFHGSAKPSIPLGMSVDDERGLIERFLERLSIRRAEAAS